MRELPLQSALLFEFANSPFRLLLLSEPDFEFICMLQKIHIVEANSTLTTNLAYLSDQLLTFSNKSPFAFSIVFIRQVLFYERLVCGPIMATFVQF